MAPEKPWKIDAVIWLVSVLMLSLVGGFFVGQALVYLLHPGMSGLRFLQFLVSTLSFHGMAVIMTTYFLKMHDVTWTEFLGASVSRPLRVVAVALAATIIALPFIMSLNVLSASLMKLVEVTPELQAPVKVLQVSVSLPQRIAFGITAIFLAPFSEEILFRGVLYPFIKQYGYPRLALWGSSLLFAAIHLNIMTFFPLTVLALLLVWLYERTGSLLAPIVTHCSFNAANFFMLIYDPEITRWWNHLRERI